MRFSIGRAIASLVATFVLGAAITVPATASDPGAPPPGFTAGKTAVNGTALHYVRGGRGPALILLHGFPQDWTEYRAIMPRLASRFTVVAIDLPGVGKSGPAFDGYDAAHMAADIHALAGALRLERPYVVGHDLGGVATYAYLRQFAGDIRGAMVLDVPIPGLPGWDESPAGFWHIRFIQEKGQLAEKLVVGRQAAFLKWSFAMSKFTAAEKDHFVKSYGPKQIHDAFEIYRAFPADGEWNATQVSAIAVPVVVAVGERSFFARFLDTFVGGMRAKGIEQVTGARIPGASHYVVADSPDAVAELIERNAAP